MLVFRSFFISASRRVCALYAYIVLLLLLVFFSRSFSFSIINYVNYMCDPYSCAVGSVVPFTPNSNF